MQTKRSPLPLILLSVVGLAVLVVGLALWLMTPKAIYDGYYSAINEHRAAISDTEYIRDVYVDENGAGHLSTCDQRGASVDVIAFGSYRLQGNTVCFEELSFYGQQEGRRVVWEEDGSCSLTLSFSLKEGGFVMDACHYERIKQ